MTSLPDDDGIISKRIKLPDGRMIDASVLVWREYDGTGFFTDWVVPETLEMEWTDGNQFEWDEPVNGSTPLHEYVMDRLEDADDAIT